MQTAKLSLNFSFSKYPQHNDFVSFDVEYFIFVTSCHENIQESYLFKPKMVRRNDNVVWGGRKLKYALQ